MNVCVVVTETKISMTTTVTITMIITPVVIVVTNTAGFVGITVALVAYLDYSVKCVIATHSPIILQWVGSKVGVPW